MAKNTLIMEELIDLAELRSVLEEYAQQAVEIYKYQIALGAHNASRKLTDTIYQEIKVEGSEFMVCLHLQEYWKYIEGGSKGKISSPPGAVYPAHFPSPEVLMKWIEVKPVIPRPMANGDIPSPQTLAFLIGRKIMREGIEPFPALEETKKEAMKIFEDRIKEALGHDLEIYIKKLIVSK